MKLLVVRENMEMKKRRSKQLAVVIARRQLSNFLQQFVAFILELEQVLHNRRLYRVGGQPFFSLSNGSCQFNELSFLSRRVLDMLEMDVSLH